jgi:hypothetical protein
MAFIIELLLCLLRLGDIENGFYPELQRFKGTVKGIPIGFIILIRGSTISHGKY